MYKTKTKKIQANSLESDFPCQDFNQLCDSLLDTAELFKYFKDGKETNDMLEHNAYYLLKKYFELHKDENQNLKSILKKYVINNVNLIPTATYLPGLNRIIGIDGHAFPLMINVENKTIFFLLSDSHYLLFRALHPFDFKLLSVNYNNEAENESN